MFRSLLLGFLIYGMVIGLRDGWLVVKWGRFFHSIGFTKVDPNKPMNWQEFIINNLDRDSLIQSKDKSLVE